HDDAEVPLGGTVRRAVVVGQVKVGDTEVKRAPQDGALGVERPVGAEVVPQPQGDLGQVDAAAPAPAVADALISVLRCYLGHARSLPPPARAGDTTRIARFLRQLTSLPPQHSHISRT